MGGSVYNNRKEATELGTHAGIFGGGRIGSAYLLGSIYSVKYEAAESKEERKEYIGSFRRIKLESGHLWEWESKHTGKVYLDSQVHQVPTWGADMNLWWDQPKECFSLAEAEAEA